MKLLYIKAKAGRQSTHDYVVRFFSRLLDNIDIHFREKVGFLLVLIDQTK